VFAVVYCSMQLDSIRTEDEALIKGNDMTDKQKTRVHKRRGVLDDLRIENSRELLAALCNLVVLLNRLEFGGPFRRVPTWIAAIFGIVASYLGMLKNWPVKQKV
jgi:hypothetical protein